MQTSVHGIHHVTAVAGDAQQNLDFYVGVMGMRMVKKTVNQDAPHIYHLFYADGAGTPGTDITFFPWPDIAPTPGRVGIGLTVEVPFAIRAGEYELLARTSRRAGCAARRDRDPLWRTDAAIQRSRWPAPGAGGNGRSTAGCALEG